MTDSNESAGETYSKEFVESLQAKIAAQSEETAKLRAFKSTHDDKQREIISTLQPDIKAYVADLVANNPDHANEMKSMQEWTNSCHESNSLETAMPLARILSCASVQYKRTREEASVGAERDQKLSSTMKELEEIKGDRDMKVQRIQELEKLCSDRQDSMEKLQEALAKAGVLKEKFDFSKLSSREANASDENSATNAGASASGSSDIKVTTSLASRGVEDELFNFINGNASNHGSHRFQQSSTNHALLGSSSGSVDAEIAAAVRGY